MIGQNKHKEFVERNIKNFPHFVILVGNKGTGKRTFAKYIANELGAFYTETDIKVDEIRSIIDTAYNSQTSVVYCIADADNMRAEAKNAILKITEEPPKNAYFIVTVQDDSTLLGTWKSRGYVLEMQPYTQEELCEYAHSRGYEHNPTATTPYEDDMLNEYGNEFLEYVKLVMDNIAGVQPANAFKSSSKLALKSDDGYDLSLFWMVFIDMCIAQLKDDPLRYTNGALETMPYYLKSRKLGVNKQQVYDMWVMKIREVWSEYN